MGIKSFYVRTDDGLELMHIQTNVKQPMRPCTVSNYGHPEKMYQVMFDDSVIGEGTFVYDYVSFDAPTQDFQLFLNRNLNK